MDKRFFGLLLWFTAFVIPSHAVLKEADLNNTLSILRVELTNYYNDLQSQQQGHKRMRQEVISNLINISRKSSQNALMLYSQKPDYVFDLTYACNEATNLYKDYHRTILPFRTIIAQTDIEVARYDSLVNSLNKMGTRNLSEKASIDRNVCLTLSVSILRTLKENKESMNEYINIYKITEDRLTALNDYAIIRYNEIQNNIFINGGENYFSILRSFSRHMSQTKETVVEKYEPYKKVNSQWDSRVMGALFLFIMAFGGFAVLLNFIGLKYFLPKRFRSEGFLEKRTCISMATTVVTFAIILQILRLLSNHNFFIMASGLLTQYAWLLSVILISLLLRLNGKQIKSAFHIYAPLIVIGFVVITYRIILIPNELVNLMLPPIVLICAIWQWWAIRKHNQNVPRSDMFYTYISLLAFVISVICSWLGYTLLSVQLLIWWIMQLTCILTITCLRSWIKAYGERHHFEEKPVTESWFYNFLYSVLLPSLAVASILIAIYWAADVFNLNQLTWRVFSYQFIKSPNITISILNIAIVIVLWMLFSYINKTLKSLLKQYFESKDPTSSGSRYMMSKNVIQLIVWGLWLILSLAICHVDNTWLVVVSGGLSTGIGFASKDILENIYYGISLMTGRLKVGDWIICDGIRGKVESISYTSTMLEAIDGSVIAFQNSQLFTKNYKNMTKNHGYELRILDVGVAYGTDIERTRHLLVEEISKLDFIDPSHNVRVLLREFGDSSVNLKILVWVPVLSQYVCDCKILECVYNTLNKHNISIPFPQRDLHIVSDEDGKMAALMAQ